jgi:small subunit ribosomal protein S13
MTINPNLTVLEYLTKAKALGPVLAASVCDKWGVSYKTLIKDLSEEKLELLEKHPHGSQQQRQQINIARLISIGCHRGLRLKQGLPARGQRTRSNAKTAKRLNARRVG